MEIARAPQLLDNMMAAAVLCLLAPSAVADLRARDVRVEFAQSPVVGVAVPRPRFSWALEHAPGGVQRRRGESQACSRVTVTPKGAARPAWDSGAVPGNTTGVACGADLASDTDYELVVATSSSRGCADLQNGTRASFSTALMDDSEWAGSRWLTLGANDTRNQFRANLQLPAGANTAQGRCYIAGLGYHRSWLNGQRLAHHADDTLGPFVQFQRRTPYDSFDVTASLRPGNNTLAVLLGKGWYALPQDKFTAVLGYRTVGMRSLRVQCRVTLTDGRKLRFSSGEAGGMGWVHGAGELRSDHLFLGETIDKRLATPGWQLPAFDASGWARATAAVAPPPPPPPPPPPQSRYHCPAGQKVDIVAATGDNGSCDCDEYCGSDWSGSLHHARPHWLGAISAFTNTTLNCQCVQATHWCGAPHALGCGSICKNSTPPGLPTAHNFCVSNSTPSPPPPVPGGGQLEWKPIGKMTSLLIPHVRRHEPRSPVSITRTSSGSYLLDFTFNQAMQCTLRIETDGSQAGTALRLHHGEQQDAAGSLLISNDLGGLEDQTTFILSDAVGSQTFETKFAYFGARFVDIAGWPADSAPTSDSMTCYFVHSALPRLSQVRVSSTDDTATILNGIHEITMRSALSNFMSTPTDCPSREKRGWTGDGQAAAETLIYNFDMSVAYPKWLGDIADAQQCNFQARDAHAKCPAEEPWCRTPGDGALVPEITPLLFDGKVDGCAFGSDPAWGSGFIAIIDWVHRYYGDRQVLEQHYGGGAAYLDLLLEQVNTSAGGSSLLDLHYETTRYGDWCAPLPKGTALHSNITARHTSNLINGFYWLKQLRIMSEAAVTLGKTADAQKWAKLASDGQASYNRLYFDAEQGLYRDIECMSNDDQGACHTVSKMVAGRDVGDGELSVQTAQSLPLFLGLPATQADRKRVGDALANDVMNGTFPGRTTTGLVGTKYFLGELVDAGHADVALTVASATGYPSWGRMLPPSVHPDGQGEGTLWEQWGGDLHVGDGSRNHIMLGGFDGPYFYGRLAGIRNAGLAWDRVLIAPTGPSSDGRRLTGVAATVGTLRGDIAVEWSAGANICSEGQEKDEVCVSPAVLNCSGAGVIEAITFANYGTSTGSCGNFTKTCTGDDSLAVVEKHCLGKPSCVVNASASTFAHGALPYDPCPGLPKTLVVQARCSGLISMQVSLPVGVAIAEVRLPLGSGGATAESVTVTESGTVIWHGGKHVPGVAGVVSVAPFEDLAGRALSVHVESGAYSFVVLKASPFGGVA